MSIFWNVIIHDNNASFNSQLMQDKNIVEKESGCGMFTVKESNPNEGYLEGSNLKGLNLTSVELMEVNLEGSNLKGANLKGANLKGANLEGANLEGANLEGADLSWAILRGDNLEATNLIKANLKKANLKRANLREADLFMANLEGANLKETHFLSFDQFSKVKTLYDTKLDEELLTSLKGKYPCLFRSLEQQFLEHQSSLLL